VGAQCVILQWLNYGTLTTPAMINAQSQKAQNLAKFRVWDKVPDENYPYFKRYMKSIRISQKPAQSGNTGRY